MAYLRIHSTWLPYQLMSDKHGYISLGFGTSGHTGVDSVGNQYANPVCAVLSGRVVDVVRTTTLGDCVYYSDGTYTVAHYHLASISVKTGDQVIAGKTKVGIEGSTGTLAKGKHLHTSVWLNNQLVDPEPYLCGQKAFKKEAAKKMFREVTAELNLRSSMSTTSNKNIIKALPVGTLLEVVKVTGEWGRVIAYVGGQALTGYCKIATTWSKEVV